ncbi:MAG: hypothetical protein IPJ77_19820 [Planctomycetes bacterium]|nr:hypothetical protein [Planctomycetota bacterium]
MKPFYLVALALLAQDPVADPTPRPVPDAPPAPVERAPDAPVQDPARTAQGEAPATGAETARVNPPEPAAPPALAWDGSAPRTPEELEALLARFSTAWPASVRVEAIAAAREGGRTWRASVTRAAPEDEARLPALLLVPATTSAADGAALGRLLNACAGLLERAAREPAVEARLARCSVQFLFATEPTRAFQGGWPEPALDYPVGWKGGVGRPPHPLHEPETRAIAEFLLQHPSIGVLAFEAPSIAAPYELGAPAEARAPGGSLERFAREYLGAGLAAWSAFPAELANAADPAAARGVAAERLVLLLDALPRLEASEPKLERVRPDLWVLEVELANRGTTGTLEGSAAARERSSAWLDVAGADLAAVAGARSRPGAVYEPLAARANHLELGHLGGGESVRLRLVLRGAEGAEARVVVRSLRAGAVEVVVPLR